MADLNRTVEALWRIESARLIAHLARMVRDVGLAEDLAHDALVAALEHWAKTGVPENPGGWLMTTARNRALDALRRNRRLQQKLDRYGRERGDALEAYAPDFSSHLDRSVDDDLLCLVFTTCHPLLSPEAQVALTLKLLGGLSTPEVARAFVVSEPTMAQRLVRAKRTLTAAQVPFEMPQGKELVPRLRSVLQVIYLIFNEGYSATSGDQWMRPELVEEALRLGRILAELMPAASEVHGLAALMELQASRTRARTGPGGEAVLLMDQDRSRWDHLLIGRGRAALDKAQSLAAAQGVALGPYALQAKITACHAGAPDAAQTPWATIAALYEGLAAVQPSSIVELNRAMAVAMAYGPAEGLVLLDEVAADPALRDYPWLPSARGDLLFKLGRTSEAADEFRRAAGLTRNARDREVLLARAQGLQGP